MTDGTERDDRYSDEEFENIKALAARFEELSKEIMGFCGLERAAYPGKLNGPVQTSE